MIIESQHDVTTAVLSELQRAPDPRFREIMSAFVRHLHDLVREVRLTEEEFRAAVAYVVALGKRRDIAFPLPLGRGDQMRHGGSGPDPRELPSVRARNIYDPYGHIDQIKLKTRDFRDQSPPYRCFACGNEERDAVRMQQLLRREKPLEPSPFLDR
jgi:hypothetical protein